MSDLLVQRAAAFAVMAHGEQKRKYTGEPYWLHPSRVRDTLARVRAPWGGQWDDEVFAAAWLHDVVEDTSYTLEDIYRLFGSMVEQLVGELTNVSKLTDGSREKRKAMDRERLAKVSPEAQSIKLADILDNTPSIVQYGGKFAKIYLAEMKLLVPLLTFGHPVLYSDASALVTSEWTKLVLTVPCSYCGAVADEPCTMPSGGNLRYKWHNERERALKEL